MGFSRQEDWHGLPCPPPGDLSDPGVESVALNVSCIGRWFLYHQRHLGSPVLKANSNTASPGKLSQTPQNLSLFLLHLEHHVYGSQDTLMNILCSQVAVIHWIGTHLA